MALILSDGPHKRAVFIFNTNFSLVFLTKAFLDANCYIFSLSVRNAQYDRKEFLLAAIELQEGRE